MSQLNRVVTSGIRRLTQACAIALCLAGAASPAFAVVAAPEINPMSAGSAVALLVGGVLLLSTRNRSKQAQA